MAKPKMRFEDDNTVMKHPHYPNLRIVRHPYSSLTSFNSNIQSLPEKLLDKALPNIPKKPQEKPVENSYDYMPVLEMEPGPDLTSDMSNVLDDIHPDFRPHVKGDINVLANGENVPSSHLAWDRANFPYTKSLKGINYKSPSSTLEHGSMDLEHPIKMLISTNLIHDYLHNNPEAPAKINRLIQEHKILRGHKLPEFKSNLFPAKQGSYGHERPHLTQMSGLDKLKLMLYTTIMPTKQFSGLEKALREITERTKVQSENPGPLEIHQMKMTHLAKDILEHAMQRKIR